MEDRLDWDPTIYALMVVGVGFVVVFCGLVGLVLLFSGGL